MTKTYKIHPALGIARMGNLPLDVNDSHSFFNGSESPFEIPNNGMNFKVGGRLKKQAQRFWIYEYEDGVATGIVNMGMENVADISWHVELGNRKSALDTTDKFNGKWSKPHFRPADFLPSVSRNMNVPETERQNLCMNTGFQSVSHGQTAPVEMNSKITLYAENTEPKGEKPLAKPLSKEVNLGSIFMDKSGGLLVFASDGLSEGIKDGAFSKNAVFGNAEDKNTFANSDNWYDTTADGPVHATITFKDGSVVKIDQPDQAAWVLCVLPKYAPAFNYFTNLQHVSESALHEFDQPVGRASFARDIYPVLRSISELQWVSGKGMLGHGTGKQGYYLDFQRMKLLSDNNTDPGSDAYRARNGVFSRVRNPFNLPKRPFTELTTEMIEPKQMPQLPDEVINHPNPKDWDLGSVTKLQYLLLEKWRDGDFDPDPDGVYDFKPLSDYPMAEQPDALDRAAVAGSTGSPFYPGIESWSIMNNEDMYVAPLRMKAEVEPGDLTMGNALPWQADYLDCSDTWWPVQRPDQVTRNGKTLQSWTPLDWHGGGATPDYAAMVNHWYELGFIYSKDNGVTFEEQERSPDLPNP